MNNSEQLFEEILNELKVSFTKIPETTENQTPDYEIMFDGLLTYWEVKQVEENFNEKEVVHKVESGDVVVHQISSDRIMSSIKGASKQFKGFNVTNNPCIVVLSDQRNFAVRDLWFEDSLKSLMLGKAHYMPDNNGEYFQCYREPGIFTSRKKYISAVAVIYETTKNIVLFHNPNAEHSIVDSPVRKVFKDHYCALKVNRGVEWVKID